MSKNLPGYREYSKILSPEIFEAISSFFLSSLTKPLISHLEL